MDSLAFFSKYLGDYLKEKNYYVLEFSRKIDISDDVITQWLSTQFYPSPKSAIKLANYFNCSIDYLFGLKADKSYQKSASNETFQYRYKMLLEECHHTAGQLAKKINIGVSPAYRWKRCGTPSIPSIIALAKFFKVSMDYLLIHSDYKF